MSKSGGFRLEPLEDRRMLALLGVVPDFPLIAYNSTGILTYDASSNEFDIEATPLTFQETGVSPVRAITNTPVPSFELHILVDNSGVVTGGVPGDDLRIFGDIDIDGDTVVDVSGTLLTGEVMQFGFQNVGTTDFNDFRFKVTGGLLAGYFAGKDIAIFNSSESSTFTGSFEVDFRGGAKGSVGSIDALVPGIEIVKSVEHDLDCEADIDGSGVVALFQPNDVATYQYDVTNTGNTVLDITSLEDVNDNGTPGNTGDDIVIVPTPILNAGFNVGDTNTNNQFDPGETWRFEADLLLDTAGYHSNVVTVEAAPVDGNGDPILNLDDVTDSDDLRVFVAIADMTLEKRVNSQDANVEPPPFDHVLLGSQVNYSYLVTNTGNVILELANFLDDNGTPINPGDDFTPLPVLVGGFNIGDADQDGRFDPGESWEFEFLNVTLNTLGLHTNIATVDGLPVDINGEEIDEECVPPSSATDPANIYVDLPQIDLTKVVLDPECIANIDGQGDVPLFQTGELVTYQYTIDNPGTTPLLVNLVDVSDNGTPLNPADDITTDLIINGVAQPGVILVGDIDNDNLLDTNETWTATFQTSFTALGLISNVANVTGTPTDGDGNPLTGFSDVADVDDAEIYIADAGIQLVKFVNDKDANSEPPPFDTVLLGSLVNYTYAVTNTGNVILSITSFVDDNGTPGNPGDDFTPTQVLLGGFNVGDADQDGRFDPSETWLFEELGVQLSTVGLHTNTAVVNASPVEFDGTVIDPECLPPVSDTDPANIRVIDPEIAVDKVVVIDPDCILDIDGNGPVPVHQPGDLVTFQYTVTNTGSVDLLPDLIDDNGTPGNIGDDINLVIDGVVQPGVIVVSMGNNDAFLDVGEAWVLQYQKVLNTPGSYENIATAIGTPLGDNNQPIAGIENVLDTDDAEVFIAFTGIQIEKRVNSQDANTEPPPFPEIEAGDFVNYSYLVTNTGNVILEFTSLLDDMGGVGVPQTPSAVLKPNLKNIGDANDNGKFDPGESWEFEKLNIQINAANTAPDLFINTATVQAVPVEFDGTRIDDDCLPAVSDSDIATVRLIVTSSLSGYVWEDCDNDGIFDADEFGIGGVTVQLFVLSNGNYIPFAANPDELTSNVPGMLGFYEFTDLPAGTYRIVEVQPGGYFDGKDTIGPPNVVPGGVDQSVNDQYSNIVIPVGQSVDFASFNFGELTPSSIAGCVYVDVNNNGVKDPGETDIAGVKITLSGVDDLGAPVNLVDFSDMNGEFKFENLRPAGGAGYTLTQEHPILFIDGKDSVGTAGGVASNPQPDLDTITQILIEGCDDATGYCFGEFGYKIPSKRPFIYTNGIWQNTTNPIDVNADGNSSPQDALMVIDSINRLGMGLLPAGNGFGYFPDTNGDSSLTPADVLKVIDEVNRKSSGILSATSSSATGSSTGVGAKSTISSKSSTTSGAVLADMAFGDVGSTPAASSGMSSQSTAATTASSGSSAPVASPRPLTGEELLAIALGLTEDEADEAADELYETISAGI